MIDEMIRAKAAHKKAYAQRYRIRKFDILEIECVESNNRYCYFRMANGTPLCCRQPALNRIRTGDTIQIQCDAMLTRETQHWKTVDYKFTSEWLPNPLIISGPDAQALKIVSKYEDYRRNLHGNE